MTGGPRPDADPKPPRLRDESRWYTEHTALLISTLKWSVLGAGVGFCVGGATRGFLWALSAGSALVARLSLPFPYWWLLPAALPACVWLIRTFAPTARGHGTEAVITAIHQRSGKIDWRVAPVKLLATVLTLAFGGSVGKEGPCAQIGAAITSLFADLARMSDADRRRLVICGVGAGFAAVFGTPISGALFGIEVLYLGRIEYEVLFPCVVAGIVAHLVCGVSPAVPAIHSSVASLGRTEIVVLAIVVGAICGVAALLLIETMRGTERLFRRFGFERRPYLLAAGGGVFLAAFYTLFGADYSGLGLPAIESALSGTFSLALAAFALKIVSTSVTLEVGGSGGIVTPLFFIGTAVGAAFARIFHLPVGAFAAFGMVGLLAAGANTPIAASVMGMELLPGQLGVYAALAAGAAFLLVGHRSVYASQKIGLSKSAGLDVRLDIPVGELDRSGIGIREGSLTGRFHEWGRSRRPESRKPDST
jgi:H+/Cl- antiporter ClcA